MRRRLPLGPVLAVGALLVTSCERVPVSVRIRPPRDAVEAQRADATLPTFRKKGETILLRASGYDRDGAFLGPAAVLWESSDPSVATVEPDGRVTVRSSGHADISARSVAGAGPLEATIPVEVSIVGKVRINPRDASVARIHLGDTRELRVDVLDDRDRLVHDARVRWRATSYAVTVTDGGELEGRAMGKTEVIAESAGVSDRIPVEVLDWPKARSSARKRHRRR